MSRLREPGLGPVVGHTTHKTCRIWIRGADPGDRKSNLASERRTMGIAAIVKVDGVEVKKPQPYYFRLHRKFDRTGTFTFGEGVGIGDKKKSSALKPDTLYYIKVGTLSVDDPYDNDEHVSDADLANILPPAQNWVKHLKELPNETSRAKFRTLADGKGEKVSFLLGSCRYPGILWKAKDSDKIFHAVLAEAKKTVKGLTPKMVLMVGDQIYADMMNRNIPLGLADTYEEFQDRYLTAFGSRNMRKLLQRIPTYMVLDDHEIEDNWSQDRLFKNSHARKVFNLAIGAYMSYQWSHSPRSHGKRLFYNFQSEGFPFFVLDTRTQRYIDDIEDNLDDNHLLGRPSAHTEESSQLQILLNWLKKQPRNVPKFIVSSSVFAPNPMFAREERMKDLSLEKQAQLKQKTDSWPAFPSTKRELLKFIVDNKIQNVVFVSGDVHCSSVAELFFSQKNKALPIKAFSITSSAFYWPFPFADGDPSDFVHNSKKEGQKDTFNIDDKRLTMDYVAKNFTQEDNFCRVDVDKATHSLIVNAYDSSGDLIKNNSGKGLTSKLKLEPWD
jgi:alkaline phosphatase D